MELIKKRIRTNMLGKTITDQFMMDDDYNVPDSKKDVGRVISGDGTLKIEEVKTVENYLRVTGKLFFKILYVTDDLDPSLASLEGSLPFEEMIYMEEAGGENYVVHVSRVDFSASVIHSRKLGLKMVAELMVHSEQTSEEEITTDVETTQELHKKVRNLGLLQLHTNKRDIYRIKEEITIPGTKENIGALLWTDVQSRKMDTRLSQDALQIKGELQVFCFYESQEGKTDWIEQTVPYEGSVTCLGVDETLYHHIYDQLSDIQVEVRMDEDGEMRALGVEATLEMRILIYEEEQAQILEDVYALAEECIPEKRETLYEELLMQNHSKCKVTEKLSLPELKDEILQVCHSSGILQVEKMEVTLEGIQIDGVLHVSFLYVKANDAVPFDMWQGVIPFSYLLESGKVCPEMRYDITYSMEQLSVTLSGNDEVEIKAALSFKSFLRRPIQTEVITNLEFRAFDEAEVGKRPGIIGYIVKENDQIWDLAKRYYTTVEGIMKINQMSSEELKEGDKILIFKENMRIL